MQRGLVEQHWRRGDPSQNRRRLDRLLLLDLRRAQLQVLLALTEWNPAVSTRQVDSPVKVEG
jgi:hypothetical protein